MEPILIRLLEQLILILTPVGLVLLGGTVVLGWILRVLWQRMREMDKQYRDDMDNQRKIHGLYAEYLGKNTEVLQELRRSVELEATHRTQLNDRILSLLQDLTQRGRGR